MDTFVICVFSLLAGIGVGIPACYHIVYRSFLIFPRLSRLNGLSFRETLPLLFTLFRSSLMWVLVIAGSLVLAFLLSSTFWVLYFLGLLIALACSLIESSRTRDEAAERKITELLDQALAKPVMEPGEPYPSYSAHTMENDNWYTNCASIKAFRDLRWKCAVCGGVNLFTQQKVVLRGTRMRFVVRCYLCGKHSVVRVSGLVNCRLITEARVPDFQGPPATAVPPAASHGGR